MMGPIVYLMDGLLYRHLDVYEFIEALEKGTYDAEITLVKLLEKLAQVQSVDFFRIKADENVPETKQIVLCHLIIVHHFLNKD
jgi:hypothetical protein